MMTRRTFLTGLSGLLVAGALPAAGKETYAVTPLTKSKSDWKALLPADRYGVLFEENTERPFTSPLNDEKRSGAFVCAACFLPCSTLPRSTTVAPVGRASSTRARGPSARKRTSS